MLLHYRFEECNVVGAINCDGEVALTNNAAVSPLYIYQGSICGRYLDWSPQLLVGKKTVWNDVHN